MKIINKCSIYELPFQYAPKKGYWLAMVAYRNFRTIRTQSKDVYTSANWQGNEAEAIANLKIRRDEAIRPNIIDIQLACDFGTWIDFGGTDEELSIDNYMSVAQRAVSQRFPDSDVLISLGSGNVDDIIEIDGDRYRDERQAVRDILSDIFQAADWYVEATD